jgi:hypothetical protein
MQIKTSIGDINIPIAAKDESDWITIQSQSVSYSKTEFFIKSFNSDFPSYTLLGKSDLDKFKFLSDLCARTEALKLWFAAVSIKYSDTTQLPLYLKNVVEPDEYKAIQEKLLVLKDALAEVTKERNDLAVKYRADLDQLRVKEQNIISKTIGADNTMKIVSLSTDALPLSIQMRIQSYMANSEDADVADNRRRLAQEYLAKFKTELIILDKIKPIANIDALIDEIALK